MTYARLKKLIERGAYNKEDMLNKMDVFLMANRITEEQYQELVGMMGCYVYCAPFFWRPPTPHVLAALRPP